MESNIDSVERGAGKNKRKWTELEDGMLIEALLELVNNGKFKAEKGFKSGYLGYLESALETKLPNSGIKGKPHIESRIKTLKTNFNMVYDLRYGSTSGFGWDPINEVVTAPKDVWDSYNKVHVGAAKWKTTPFPHFDELSIIFGKDRATGLNAESVFEVEEDINAVESAAAATLEGGQGGFPDMDSFMQNSDESTCRVGSKRKKVDVDPTIEAMYAASKMIATEFANSTRVIASEFASSTKMLIAAETDRLEKKEKLSEELSKISGINVLEKFQAAKKIADRETLMVLFFGAPDEEKYELVHAILRGEI